MPFQSKHGFSGTKFYNQWRYLIWSTNPKPITPTWKYFDSFLIDMYEQYLNVENIYSEDSKISLKRLDKNKKYSKENCYWGINKSINRIKLDNVIIIQDENGEYVLEDIFKFCKINNIKISEAKEKFGIKIIQKVG